MSEENPPVVVEPQQPILVNGEEVREALIQQELQLLRERYVDELGVEEMAEQWDKVESDARENAVERILLMQKAREVMEPVRPEEIEARFAALQDQHGGKEAFYKQFELKPEDEEKLRADIADGVQLEKYFDTLCEKVARPTEEEVREYYTAHPEEFSEPERVHAMHIIQHPSDDCPVEKVYADLLNIRERLLAGESFEELAAEFSHCQDGGEDLGYFTRGQMVASFEEVAFATPVGEISDVFKSEFGYHILKVYDYQPERTRAFDEVRYDIEALMMNERKNDAIGLMADELRAAAHIENLLVVD